MRASRVAQVITSVSLHGSWVKLLQARWVGEGQISLLGLKARHVEGMSEEAISKTLKELVHALPLPTRNVLGLLSTGELLTRYLTLPSEDPSEIKAMAHFQLEGLLPYPVGECVTSVKVLGPAGEATRVLAAAAHRPVVERLVRICKGAGLELTGIAASSEAIGFWHQACWPPAGATVPRAWLVAELTVEGLELGVLVDRSLIYMRQIASPPRDLEQLTSLLRETIQAYAREQVGPPVEQVTVSGHLDPFGPASLEMLEAALELPVHRVDPLERSPFPESLSVVAQGISPEVSFSELLGVACGVRLLGLDLLPTENRISQAKEALFRELRTTALLLSVGLFLVLGWVGARAGGTWWFLQETQAQIRLIKPQAAQVQAMVASVRSIGTARAAYAFQMETLTHSTKFLLPGMTLQYLGLEAGEDITLKGTAPDLASVTRYLAVLRDEPIWAGVILHSAKTKTLGGIGEVEFEVLLLPKNGKRKLTK